MGVGVVRGVVRGALCIRAHLRRQDAHAGRAGVRGAVSGGQAWRGRRRRASSPSGHPARRRAARPAARSGEIVSWRDRARSKGTRGEGGAPAAAQKCPRALRSTKRGRAPSRRAARGACRAASTACRRGARAAARRAWRSSAGEVSTAGRAAGGWRMAGREARLRDCVAHVVELREQHRTRALRRGEVLEEEGAVAARLRARRAHGRSTHR